MTDNTDQLAKQLSASLSLSSLSSTPVQTEPIVAKVSDMGEGIPTYSNLETIPDPYKIVQGSQDPRENAILTTHKWRLTPLFKKDAKGALMLWWVGYDLDTQELMMIHGQVGGKLQVSRTKVEINQSGRPIHEQSVLEARQRYLLKYRNEMYRQPGEKVGFFNKPMLAQVWKPGKTKLRYPLLVQPKLDGARCLVRPEGNEIIYRSRGDVRWPHLNSEFDPEISTFLAYIPYQCELDGEMYMHGLKFSQFSKILKNMTVKDPRISELKYFIYDFNTSERLTMEQRWSVLDSALKRYKEDGYENKRFEVLFTATANTEDEIRTWHTYFTQNGFEGTIIRKTGIGAKSERDVEQALYKSGRGMNILKHKDFEDAEGVVVGVTNASGTEEGCALLMVRVQHFNAQGVNIVSDLTLRPAFSFDERREWFAHPELVIGRPVTYKYQGVSEYGVPRFPVMKDFRDFEGDIRD